MRTQTKEMLDRYIEYLNVLCPDPQISIDDFLGKYGFVHETQITELSEIRIHVLHVDYGDDGGSQVLIGLYESIGNEYELQSITLHFDTQTNIIYYV